jgi:hypothetical protein
MKYKLIKIENTVTIFPNTFMSVSNKTPTATAKEMAIGIDF